MILHFLLVAMAAGLLISCDKAPAPQPVGTRAIVSMNPSSWIFQYSPGMPANANPAAGGGWQFDFPSSDGVHMIVHPVSGRATTHFRIRGEIQGSGTPFFEWRTNPNNTCDSPSHARFYAHQRGADFTADNPYGRWWPTQGIKLQLGGFELQVPITPALWSSVFGAKGDTNTAGFQGAMNDLQMVGLTIGGGCFYGHGVYVTGGTATFIVREFEVK